MSFQTGPEFVWNGVATVREDSPNAPIYQAAGSDLRLDLTPVRHVAMLLSNCFYEGQ